MYLRIGDVVRVSGLWDSEWRDSRGVVVEVYPHTGVDQAEKQECVVKFSGEERRWFLAEHLMKIIPDRALRFFRAEVLDRWRHLDPDQVASLNGDLEGLTGLLQNQHDFCARRAQAEVEEFYNSFCLRIELAAGAQMPLHNTGSAAA